jgi:selenocysteine lyase/cysteine desulfurase
VSYDLDRLRAEEFPWTSTGDVIYLNNASTGPLPRRTVIAISDFTAARAEPWTISEEMQFGTLSETRERLGRLIGAPPSQIALMVNTSYGINVAARCLPFERGDVVITSDREFPANIYPWMALEEARGVELVRVPCDGALPDEDALLAALDRPRVKALTISWVSFSTGYRVNLERLGAACRERGIWFVVDAIQGLGAATVDVSRCNIDVFACGGQKWLLSPWGSGFVYLRDELVHRLDPSVVGWMAVKGSDDFTRLVDYDLTWRDDARRFEVITLPFQEFAGLNASLRLLEELGPRRIETHVASLATRIVSWAKANRKVELVTPADAGHRAGIVSVRPPDAAEASRRLTDAGVYHSFREGAIRLAPHCYNTAEEVDRALELLVGRRQPVSAAQGRS